MTEWQPIATAPRDQRQLIMVWTDTGPYFVQWHDGRWLKGDDFLDENSGLPTHWMPLPEPPK